MANRNRKGVPVGYQHNWKYRGHWKERKVRPGQWDFTFNAKKTRAGASTGGLKRGQTVKWRIKGYQTATKVSGRTYKTTFTGHKELVGIMPQSNQKTKRSRIL